MVKFDIDKNGYDVEQVEEYINALTIKYEQKLSDLKDRNLTMKNELNMIKERLEIYQNKDKQISKALVFAVDKAGQIENSARKLYDLEIKRISLLYNHLNIILEALADKFKNKLTEDEDISGLVEEFKRGIESVMAQHEVITQSNIKQELKSNSDNYIKNLLNKMDYVINSDKAKKKAEPRKKTETTISASAPSDKPNIGNRLKFISNQLDGKSADKYLNDEKEIETSAYSKNFVRKAKENTSGFSLEDALNPKEDLEEIMKAFDFYIPENSNKKVD